MKKYLLLNLLTCFFFSPSLYAEASSTTPSSDHSPSYTQEQPATAPSPATYKPDYADEWPAPEHIKEKATPTNKPYKVKTKTRTKAQQTRRKSDDYSPFFVPFDLLIFRPLGLAATIAGTAVFVVMSPFTALSAIAPPHDAFTRVADVFIIVPATYTFLRPMGKMLCPGRCRPADVRAAELERELDNSY